MVGEFMFMYGASCCCCWSDNADADAPCFRRPRKLGELGITRVGEDGDRTCVFFRGLVPPAAMVSIEGREDTGFEPSISCIS